jgi:uncharacterized protein (DUF362 family)
MLKDTLDRRAAMLRLLRLGGLAAGSTGLGLWLNGRSTRPQETTAAATIRSHTVLTDRNLPELAIVQGEEPAQITRRALEEVGGMRRFVSHGDVVVIKPNIAWDRVPEQAANTNPQVVAELVRLCLEAGAKKVTVTDVSCNDARRCFQRSGIAAAAAAAGAEVVLPDSRRFRDADLRGEVLHTWPVLETFLNADKLINVPIAKHHNLTGVALGMKNWLGILGGPRHRLHQHIHESLADLADCMRPTLTVLDAYRILLRNGPTGGNLEDVALKKTVLVSTDPVAVDAYAARAWWNLEESRLPYLKLAAQRGLGKLRFEEVRSKSVVL